MDWASLFTWNSLIALLALTLMEIVLGIDNIVFISILTGKLPKELRLKAWRLGLGLALVFRVILLSTLKWILQLTNPIFKLTSLGFQEAWFKPTLDKGVTDHQVIDAHQNALYEFQHHFWPQFNEVSIRDLILVSGGLFLIWKSVVEIHEKFDGHDEQHVVKGKYTFTSVLIQIGLLDIIFSLDSVITAVGMADQLPVMIAAVIISILVMMLFATRIGDFVEDNPTVKMLALSFLILIGVMLVAEGIGTHFDKGYIYFAMAFALVVELLNQKLMRKRATVT